ISNRELEYQIRGDELDVDSAVLNLRETLDLTPEEPIPQEVASVVERIDAPHDGRVVRLHVEEGDRVTDNATLVEMVDDSLARFEFRISPSQASMLSEGDLATIYLDAFDGSADGTIAEISSQPTPEGSSSGVLVGVDLPNSEGLIEPGAKGDVAVATANGRIVRPGEVVEPPRTRIYSDRSGTVELIQLREGENIGRGDTLIVLATPDHSLGVRQQLINISKAEIALERYKSEREDLEITSPIDGEVVEIMVETGDLVSSGTPMAEIADFGEFEVAFDVDELEISSLSPGMEVMIELDALPDEVFEGEIYDIANSGEVQSGVTTYPVTVRLSAEPGMLEGMSADITAEVARREATLSVPAEAVTTSDGTSTVRAVTDEGAEIRTVEIGLSDGVRTEILDGLSEGDEVIISSVEDEQGIFMGPRGRANP
ncbi:MAG: efflux RND transporter periplasmic adaptor subunit, partial [Clostridia bacterium]